MKTTILTRPLRRSAAFLLGITAATAPLAAQDFDVGLQQDPHAGLAIYDIHFDGPPRGQAFLLAGTLGIQLWMPPFGNLYLDPFSPLLLGPPVQLDANGQGNLKFTLPLTDNTHTPAMQAVFIDPPGNVRLSKSFHSTVNGAVPGTPFGYVIDHAGGPRNRTNLFMRGEPGTTVRYRVRRGGRIVVDRVVKIGPGGTGKLNDLPADVGPGDRWSVVYTDTKRRIGIGRSGTF